jgi:UDP-glucuronate 4-epimerase
MERDFTYIDDIVEGIAKVIHKSPENNPPYNIYNIGNSSPVKLLDFIETIEKALGKESVKEFHDMQPGDVYKTYADVSELEKNIGYAPHTSLKNGIGKFVNWYKSFYKI